jgi:hypothetical protein
MLGFVPINRDPKNKKSSSGTGLPYVPPDWKKLEEEAKEAEDDRIMSVKGLKNSHGDDMYDENGKLITWGYGNVIRNGDKTPQQPKSICNAAGVCGVFLAGAALLAYQTWLNAQAAEQDFTPGGGAGKSKRNKGKSIKRKIKRKPKTKTIKKRRITL